MSLFTPALVVLLIMQTACYQQPKCEFKAAVYEHAFINESDPITQMNLNLDVYESQVKSAKSKDAVIIVFPEGGVTGPFWDSSTKEYYQRIEALNGTRSNPCLSDNLTNQTMVPYRLSCMARNNSIMVVANFPTIEACNQEHPCPSHGAYHYNTDVIFAADGTLLAVYHKVNLYREPQFDPPPRVEYVYVDTTFGRLGIVTCFDLLWQEPTVTLVDKYKIDTLLFPTAWMDQLPYLVSVQSQTAWATGLGINVLAANLHIPTDGFMGSGIYSGSQGPINYVYDADAKNGTLVVGTLPCNADRHIMKPPIKPRASTSHQIKYQPLSEFLGVSLEDMNGTVSACQSSLCCNATYAQTYIPNVNDTGRYMLVVYQGSVSNGTRAVEICSVLWCPNGQLENCTRQPAFIPLSFQYLELHGTFSTSYVYPSVLTDDLQLLPQSHWGYERNSTRCPNSSSATCSRLELRPLEKPLAITTAALYGRKYEFHSNDSCPKNIVQGSYSSRSFSCHSN